MAEKRYYYKKDGKAAYNLKEPLSYVLPDTKGYEEITKEEWDELTYVAPQEPIAPRELTAEEKQNNERKEAIAQQKNYLAKTDYVVLKLAEALADGNDELVESIKTEYAEVLANRVTARSEINRLESEIVPTVEATVSD